MKKLILVFCLLLFCTVPTYGKSADKLDVKSNSFTDLGNYVETLELNDTSSNKEDDLLDYDDFEDEAIQDVAKRFEANSVELKLDNDNDERINTVNNDRIFKLKVNETQYNIENNIKSENMIWDSSKSFSQSFINNSRHLAPIPSVINSSKIKTNVSKSVSASLGQTYLFNSLDQQVLFVRANESTYNMGSVLSYKSDALNIAVASFSSSYNNAATGGAILSLKPINLPANSGKLTFGGAYIANEEQTKDKSTSGVFAEYKFKKLKLNAQVGQSKYSNSGNYDTSLYLIPELQLTNSLSLKTRFIRNVTQDTMQDELVLNFKPIKSKNNLEIELSATNQYTNTTSIKQRVWLSTSFRI